MDTIFGVCEFNQKYVVAAETGLGACSWSTVVADDYAGKDIEPVIEKAATATDVYFAAEWNQENVVNAPGGESEDDEEDCECEEDDDECECEDDSAMALAGGLAGIFTAALMY